MSSYYKNIIACTTILFFFSVITGRSQNLADSKPYFDLEHESKVFGHKKLYRLYLPQGYAASSKHYPVIYFFHGWGGRHFKDDNAKLEYVKLKTLIDKYQVILVMWDGNVDLSEPQPYNVGNYDEVKFNEQMKDYFPELIAHIDSIYRTLTDKQHRGIIGFSMGGFMSLFLAGKYPDKICAAVSFAGSPEFYVGYPGKATLYPVRYTFKNLWDVDVKINNGNTDILYDLNEEVRAGAQWEGKKISYLKFVGGHMVDKPGETKVFEKAIQFVTNDFKKQWNPPQHWSHYDLYAGFSVWGYQLESNKEDPGFIFLRNVTRKGFGIYTYRWLPTGPAIDSLNIKISTAPVYVPNKIYETVKFSIATNSVTTGNIESDAQGKIKMDVDGSGTQIGIFDKNDDPEFVFLDCKVKETDHYLHICKGNALIMRLFNRGGENKLPPFIRVVLSTSDLSVKITDTVMRIKTEAGKRIISLPPFDISCFKKSTSHAEPADIKFNIAVFADRQLGRDDFTVPAWFDAPDFNSIQVDDGISIRDSALGHGNANGIADAGENIMVYQGAHRLRLYTDDPWIKKEHEKLVSEVIPARWPDGFTLSSVIRIESGCPDGHVVECLASYETKTFNPIERKLTWGKVKLIVHHPN